MKLPLEESHLRTKAQFLADLAVSFGGYAAEQIVFKEVTTGSSGDIQNATDVAERLVTQYGMSEKLGPRAFGKMQEMVFVGRGIATEKDYSESVGAKIDEEINGYLDRAVALAKQIVTKHRKVLDGIAKTLIEKETLEREEFDMLVKNLGLKQQSLKV
jgi:cell division protease FtsH